MSDTTPNDEFLTADELLGYEDIVEETLTIPEWGNKKVRIRGLTLQQTAAAAAKATRRDPRGQETIDRELMISLTVIYGMVNPKLTLDAVDTLRFKSAAVLLRISQAINAMGPTEEAIAASTKSTPQQLNGAVPVFIGPRITDDESSTHP